MEDGPLATSGGRRGASRAVAGSTLTRPAKQDQTQRAGPPPALGKRAALEVVERFRDGVGITTLEQLG